MTKDLPIYKITIDPEYSDGEELGIEQIAFTSNPAIKVKGMAFSQEVKMLFADDLKYRVTAPAMIPMEIYRRDDETGEYYVQFTAETIEQIHAKFMQDLKNRDIFNLEHDQSQQVPAYILESWIVDNPKEDKAFSTFGIEVPKGTLMITAQVTDKDYYSELVKADQVAPDVPAVAVLQFAVVQPELELLALSAFVDPYMLKRTQWGLFPSVHLGFHLLAAD